MSKIKLEDKKVSGNQCPEFRVSFPAILKPKSFQGQEPKYSIVMLFPKSTDLKELKRAVQNAAIEKWGVDQKDWPKNLKLPFRKGDEFPERKGYPGHIFVGASSKEKPGLVDQRKNYIHAETGGEEIFYAGCYARASLIAFAYDTSGNRGVSFSLQNIQKTRDGEKFSGRKAAEEEFDEIEDGSENESSYDATGTDDVGF